MDILHGDKGVFAFGPFLLDPVRRRLSHDGAHLKLPPKQFDTLLYLVENAGRVVSKDELMSAIWPGRTIEEGSLSQTVFLLRRAIQEAGGDRYIVTAPGQGYRFAAKIHQHSEFSDRAKVSDADFVTANQTSDDEDALPLPPAGRAPARPLLARWVVVTAAIALIVACGFAIVAVTRTPAFVPPPHSIAVLAFTNLSGDPAQDYFSDGLSEDLIDALGRVKALKVAASMSSFSFRGSNPTIETIARQLKVATVLEGSVRRHGQLVRISVRLIDAVTGYQLWAQSYSRNMQDILAVQDDIAASVVGVLKVALLGGVAPYAAVGGTQNAQAYDAELRAERLMESASESTFRSALTAFDDALRLDPSYADAHAGRAVALRQISSYWEPDAAKSQAEEDEALREAEKAIALAPNSAVAHLARGMALGQRLDIAGEAAEFSIAHDLNPGNALVEREYAKLQSELGHVTEAESAIYHVLDLDPLTASNYSRLALILYTDRKYDEALNAVRREEAIGGDDPMRAGTLLALIHLAQGKPKAVLADCMSTCAFPNTWRAIAYRNLGRQADAQASFDGVLKESGGDPAILYSVIYAQWGDRAAALHWLKLAVAERASELQGIRTDVLYDPLRNTPEFMDIERRLNIPP